MMIASRRMGESLMIGDTKVTILKAGGNKVRLGIEGPAVVKFLKGSGPVILPIPQEPLLPNDKQAA